MPTQLEPKLAPNLEEIKRLVAGEGAVSGSSLESHDEQEPNESIHQVNAQSDPLAVTSELDFDEPVIESSRPPEPEEVVVHVERRPVAERPVVQIIAVGLLASLGALMLGVILNNSFSGTSAEKPEEQTADPTEVSSPDTEKMADMLAEKDTQLATNQLAADVQRINEETEAKRKQKAKTQRQASPNNSTPTAATVTIPTRSQPPQVRPRVASRPRSVPVRSIPARRVPRPPSPRQSTPSVRSSPPIQELPPLPISGTSVPIAAIEDIEPPTLLSFGSLPDAASTQSSPSLASFPPSSTSELQTVSFGGPPTSQAQLAFDTQPSTLAAEEAAFLQGQIQQRIKPIQGVKATVSQGTILPNAFVVTLAQPLSEHIPAGSRLSVTPTTTYPDGKLDAQVTAIERNTPTGPEIVSVPPGAIIVERKPGKALKAKRPGNKGFFQNIGGQIVLGAASGIANQATQVDETVLFGPTGTSISRNSGGFNATTIGASAISGGINPLQRSLTQAVPTQTSSTSANVFVIETNTTVSVSVKTAFQLQGS